MCGNLHALIQQTAADAPVLVVSQACPETMSGFPLLVSAHDPVTRPHGNPMDVFKNVGHVEDEIYDETRYSLASYLQAEPATPALFASAWSGLRHGIR